MELKTLSGRKASQMPQELLSLIDFMNENKVQKYLEIGARHGDTFYEICCSVDLQTAIAVDLAGGLWGKHSSKQALQNAVKAVKNEINAHAYFMDSQAPETAEMLLREYGEFDLIFIDGDHTLEGVTKDWQNYRHMARFVAFHDIVGTGQREKVHGREVEVPILWNELKSKYKHHEFIAPESKMGIGVLCLQ